MSNPEEPEGTQVGVSLFDNGTFPTPSFFRSDPRGFDQFEIVTSRIKPDNWKLGHVALEIGCDITNLFRHDTVFNRHLLLLLLLLLLLPPPPPPSPQRTPSPRQVAQTLQSIVVRASAQGAGVVGSIPDRITPKT